MKIHPAGAVAFAAAFLFMDSRMALASAFAMLLHECAHLVVLRMCGARACVIELTPFGGMMDAQMFDLLPPWKRAAAAASGVCVSAMAAGACLVFPQESQMWKAFFRANLSLALVNMLPVWPLDGARALEAAAGFWGLGKITRGMFVRAAYLLGSLLICLALYGAWHGIINPSLLIAGPYLWYAARLGNVSERIREMDFAAHKLDARAEMPAAIVVRYADAAVNDSERLIKSGSLDRYRLILEIDRKNGTISNWITETEIWHKRLDMAGIDDAMR